MFDFEYTPETFEAPTVCTGAAPLTTKRMGVLSMAMSSINRTTWVYKITNTVNGKLYFGITVKNPPQKRWAEHVGDAYRPRYSRYRAALQRAIRKHGEAAFIFEVIYEAVDVREACFVERAKIAEAGAMVPAGYNLTSGGDAWGGHTFSPETRAQISLATTGKKKNWTPEGLERLRAFRRGWKWSEESKAKASASKKGKAWTDAQRAAILPTLLTDEYRQKMSAAKIGRPSGLRHSDEAKKRISLEQTARMASPDARKVLSDMAKRQAQDPEFRAKCLAGRKRYAELKARKDV